MTRSVLCGCLSPVAEVCGGHKRYDCGCSCHDAPVSDFAGLGAHASGAAELVSVGRVAFGYVEHDERATHTVRIPADKAEALRQFVAALGGEVLP